jgi:hypothetical protein
MWIRIVYWLLIVTFQVLVLNHLDFSAFVIPQIFIILLISMPLGWSKITQVSAGFGLGLLADLFVSTPGIHASACLWLVLLRIGILNTQDIKQQIASKMDYDVKSVGLNSFLYSSTILVFFYHFYIFWIQNIGSLQWSNYVLTSMISSVLAITLVWILQYLTFQHKS